MKQGIPFDVAHSLDPLTRRAYCVFYGQLEGGEWDFEQMQWKERR